MRSVSGIVLQGKKESEDIIKNELQIKNITGRI
jgi:hypothetical protein